MDTLNPELNEDYFDFDGDEISCTFVSDGEHLEGLFDVAEQVLVHDVEAVGSLTIKASFAKSIDSYIDYRLVGREGAATISESDYKSVLRLIEGLESAAAKVKQALSLCQILSDAEYQAWLKSDD